MKYFTPELYLRFNSAERSDVERADEAWEAAIEAYRRHLTAIAPRLAPGVRELAGTLCLHDAAYLGLELSQFPQRTSSLAVLMTRRDSTDLYLIYLLEEEPLIQEVQTPWPFSKDRVHWLYDEFDIDSHGTHQHEVLLSNGRVITLRFHELQVIKHDIAGRLAVA